MGAAPLLKLYVEDAWRRWGIHSVLLNPWWGNPYSDSSLFTKQLHDTYSFDTRCYTITNDVLEADMVLVPYPQLWCERNDKVLFRECVRRAQSAQLPLLVDGMGDIEKPIEEDGVYVLRYGGYRSAPERGRIQVPLFVDDLLERYYGGMLAVRKKEKGLPVVGFAGWVRLTRIQKLRTLIKELPLRVRSIVDTRYRIRTKGIWWRARALRQLARSPLINLHARYRSSFSGSVKTAETDLRTLQQEMVQIIQGSDYALDVRGDANNSARLFEILSLGRIPVILDTERNFPFSDTVDYSSFALVVDSNDIARLSERIIDFHTNISPEQFELMQKNAREAYLRYFRIDAVMQHIVDELWKQLGPS